MPVYIGIMSGTSVDGLDAVAIRTTPGSRMPTVLDHRFRPWSPAEREAILSAAEGAPVAAQDWLELAEMISDGHVAVARDLLNGLDTTPVTAIGMHGQTLWHRPPSATRKGASLQLGWPGWVAVELGVPVIGDFRVADLALGGGGAPLAPWAHARLFADPTEPRAVLNLGGIANLTALIPGQAVWASDVGPGNMILDDLCRRRAGGLLAFDPDGSGARRGRADPRRLAAMRRDPFFQAPFPKTTGRERFGRTFSRGLDDLTLDDALATALELTVWSVARAVAALSERPRRVIVGGGGAFNGRLMERLAEALAPCAVESSAGYGIDPQHLEAVAFALLAEAYLEGIPANLPAVTGASAPAILGVMAKVCDGPTPSPAGAATPTTRTPPLF